MLYFGESDSYKAYPTPQDRSQFFGRVFVHARTSPIRPLKAGSLGEAASRVDFPLLAPVNLPQGFDSLKEVQVWGSHTYQVTLALDEAGLLLQAAGLPAGNLPAAAEETRYTVQMGAGVVLHSSGGTRYFTILESPQPQSVPAGAADPRLPERLVELGLESFGLEAASASQIRQEWGWTWLLALPPADLTRAQAVQVRGLTALLLDSPSSDNVAVLWKEAGAVYGIYGDLSAAELLDMAESLR